MENLGALDLAALQNEPTAAYALAAYLDVCMCEAKERLGIKIKADTCSSTAPPLWPTKVDFKDITGKAAEAALHGKTALFVCNDHASEVDTFFAYRGGGATSIDATEILNQVAVAKIKSIEEKRKELHSKLESSMVQGRPVHISMGRTALNFRESYCGETEFPDAVFKNSRLREKFDGLYQDGFYTFVTTDFDLEAANEHLSKALPFFEEMAIIEVDPASLS